MYERLRPAKDVERVYFKKTRYNICCSTRNTPETSNNEPGTLSESWQKHVIMVGQVLEKVSFVLLYGLGQGYQQHQQ